VPDNPKTAVIKACFYDPQVNRTYAEMAAHYDTAVLPARPRRPRDKAKVEAAVRIVERWLLGRLRHRRFTSLAEVDAAIAELLIQLNDRRVLRHIGRTRRQLFEEIDAPRLKPLPAEPYVLAEWRVRKVGLDYHVDVDGHFYSVPYRHARASVEVRMTLRTVEVFLKGERIAAHMRGSGDGKHTTTPEHMPSSHRRYADWTIERIIREADRPFDRHALPDDPGASSASRAGLPHLSRHRAPGQTLRSGAPGGRLPARPPGRRAHLRLGQVDPRQPARRPTRPPRPRGGRSGHGHPPP
jgi:transposase